MKETRIEAPQSLRALCQLAGEQAAGPRTETLSRPPSMRATAPAQRWRLPRLALAGAAALLALAVAAQFAREDPPFTAPGVAAATVQAAPAPQFSPAEGRAEPVRWQGDELAIDLDEVPLPEAVALLADATRTTVTGAHLLQAQRTVTMHRRVNDVAAAWRLLLQAHAGYSIACSAPGCQLWITSVGAAHAAEAPPTERAWDAPRKPALTPEAAELERSQPDGSC